MSIVYMGPAFKMATVVKIGENILESWNSKFYEFRHKFDQPGSLCKNQFVVVFEKQLHEKLAVEMKATLDKTDSSKLQSKSWKIIESKL